jgi:hypothetical protein
MDEVATKIMFQSNLDTIATELIRAYGLKLSKKCETSALRCFGGLISDSGTSIRTPERPPSPINFRR